VILHTEKQLEWNGEHQLAQQKMEVIIIGAGMGGSASALLLKRHGNVNVRIYERGETAASREQRGFSLSIQANGVESLRKCVVLDKLETKSNPSKFSQYSRDGTVLFSLPQQMAQIAREDIRNCFLSELDKEGIVINYGHKCIGFEEKQDKVIVTFEGGKEESCDLLVGADGTRSAVRKGLNFPNDHFTYVGIYQLSFSVPATHPSWALFKDETASTCGSGIRVISKANYPNMTVGLSVALENGAAETKWANKEDLVKDVKQAFIDQGFHNKEAIKLLDMEPYGRYIKDRDPLKLWNVGRVVLIGDACHPMTPYKGQGANLALCDGVDLAEVVAMIVEGQDMKTALTDFQKKVLDRSEPVVNQARKLAHAYALEDSAACWHRDKAFSAFGQNGAET